MLFAVIYHRDTANDCSISLHTALFPVGSPSLLCLPLFGEGVSISLYAQGLIFLLLQEDISFLRLSLLIPQHGRGSASCTPGSRCAGGWSRACCARCGSPQRSSSATLSPEAVPCFLIGLNRAPGCLHKLKG